MTAIPAPLAAALTRVADLLARTKRPWWIIGSAAVALHGAEVAVRHDIDVLIDPADMPLIAEKAGVAPVPGIADGRFHSAHVLRLTDAPITIELFAGLRVHDGERWQVLRPTTRKPIRLYAATLYVPAAAELIDILELFGRAKDLARAALLRDLFA